MSPAGDNLWALLGLTPGRHTQAQVDAAFCAQRLHHDRVWRAWKLLRDEAYQDVYATFGEQAAVEAGFLDDELPTSLERSLWWSSHLVTPFYKLVAHMDELKPGETGVVLLTTGAFAPVHRGHLAMMESAREHLKRSGRVVLGGYISPGHDDYVGPKLKGEGLPIAHRLAICEEAVSDSDWLMVDPWEGRYAPADVNFTDVLRRLEAYLAKMFPTVDLEVGYVFGSDNLPFLAADFNPRRPQRRRPMVCVHRTELGEREERWLAMLQETGRRPELAPALGEAVANYSSTRVRAGNVDALAPASRARFAGTQPSAVNPAETRYLVRADLEWATRTWGLQPGACEEFMAGLCRALEDAFWHARRPDRVHAMRVLRLDHTEQTRRARELEQSHQVVSLDAAVPSNLNLQVSRLFPLAGGQVFSKTLVARPGAKGLKEQCDDICASARAVLLLEDDVASGTTLKRVRELLGDRVRIEGVELLTRWVLEDQRPLEELGFYDVVDARDFLVGAEEGGLVVQLPDGGHARAPYLLPWVSNVFRSKLLCSSEARFAAAVWSLNASWLRKHAPGRRVANCPAPVRCLLQAEGFSGTDSMAAIAAHYARLFAGMEDDA